MSPEGVLVPGGRFRPWRAILHTPTSHYRHNANISTLPLQFCPPKWPETPATGSSKRRWRGFVTRRVFLYREGDFVYGGRSRTFPQATTATTPTFPPSRNISALPQRWGFPPAHSDKTYPRATVGSDAVEGLVTSMRSPASSSCHIWAIELRKRFIFDSE